MLSIERLSIYALSVHPHTWRTFNDGKAVKGFSRINWIYIYFFLLVFLYVIGNYLCNMITFYVLQNVERLTSTVYEKFVRAFLDLLLG